MTTEGKDIVELPQDVVGDAPERLSSDEMLGQLQLMARQLAADAPPALREASVVAAELAAVAARNTGPLAKTLADITDDASLRFAERLEDYAAKTRAQDAAEASDQETEDLAPDDEEGAEPPSST